MTMRALSPLWGVGASGGVAATNPSRRAPGGCDTAEMVAFISHTSIDCRNAYTLSVWWEGVLDYVPDPDDPNEPGHEECLIRSRDGSHTLLFIEVPDDKVAKNRIHFLEHIEGEYRFFYTIMRYIKHFKIILGEFLASGNI